MVAPWEVYAESLFPLGYGHPLWIPEPSQEFGEVRIGDVGYLDDGRFHFLFNCMLPGDDPVNVRGTPGAFERFEFPTSAVVHNIREITQAELRSEGLHRIAVEGKGSIRWVPTPTRVHSCSHERTALQHFLS